MIKATYIGKNKEYRTEFKVFIAGKKTEITKEQYDILKNVLNFEFDGEGVDEMLEKMRKATRERRKEEAIKLEQEKERVAAQTAKARGFAKTTQLNLGKLNTAQKKLKTLIGK